MNNVSDNTKGFYLDPDFGLGVSALIIFIQELKLEWCIFPPHGDMIISFYTLIT